MRTPTLGGRRAAVESDEPLDERHRAGSIIVTSNRGPDEWSRPSPPRPPRHRASRPIKGGDDGNQIQAARLVTVALVAALVLWLATAARAQVTDNESKCQIGTSLAQGKFVTEQAKCLIKCEQGGPQEREPKDGLLHAGATATCVQLATTKAEAREQSKCRKDCPECYSGGDCTADSVTRTA